MNGFGMFSCDLFIGDDMCSSTHIRQHQYNTQFVLNEKMQTLVNIMHNLIGVFILIGKFYGTN